MPATAGLLRDTRRNSTRTRVLLWAAFAAGIVVSLAANIATAPSMAWGPILVAGWPPVALLLAVELLGHRRPRGTERAGRESVGDGQARSDTRSESPSQTETNTETTAENKKVIALVGPPLSRRTAEHVMWDHYQRTIAAGLPAPTGAELDAVAGTNNYGRAMLRKWRRTGRTGPPISVAR